ADGGGDDEVRRDAVLVKSLKHPNLNRAEAAAAREHEGNWRGYRYCPSPPHGFAGSDPCPAVAVGRHHPASSMGLPSCVACTEGRDSRLRQAPGHLDLPPTGRTPQRAHAQPLSPSATLDRVSVQGVRTGSEADDGLSGLEDPGARRSWCPIS